MGLLTLSNYDSVTEMITNEVKEKERWSIEVVLEMINNSWVSRIIGRTYTQGENNVLSRQRPVVYLKIISQVRLVRFD